MAPAPRDPSRVNRARGSPAVAMNCPSGSSLPWRAIQRFTVLSPFGKAISHESRTWSRSSALEWRTVCNRREAEGARRRVACLTVLMKLESPRFRGHCCPPNRGRSSLIACRAHGRAFRRFQRNSFGRVLRLVAPARFQRVSRASERGRPILLAILGGAGAALAWTGTTLFAAQATRYIDSRSLLATVMTVGLAIALLQR